MAIIGFAGVLVYGQFSAPSSRLSKSGENGADVPGTHKGDFQSRVQESARGDHQPTAGRYYSGNKERFLKDGSPFGKGFPAVDGTDSGQEIPQANSPEASSEDPAVNSPENSIESSLENFKNNVPANAPGNSLEGRPDGGPEHGKEKRQEQGQGSVQVRTQGSVSVSTRGSVLVSTRGSGAEDQQGNAPNNHLIATTGGVPGARPTLPIESPPPESSPPKSSLPESSLTGPSRSQSSPPTARLDTAADGPSPPLPVLKGPNVVLGSRFAADAARKGLKIPAGSDALYGAVMRYYGATFVANPRLKVPNQVIFDKSSEVSSFQKTLPLKRARLGRYSVCLQEEALTALQSAQKEALQNRLTISPVGDIASLRSYQDTTYIWHKYLEKGLLYWVSKHKLTDREAQAILASPMKKQLNAVLALESKGYYLHANHIHSILNLAAPPGCSQHISGLALDVVEHQNWRVRSILNKHGWFQTVAHDFPHFIYLGREAKELPSLGLTPLVSDGRQFWVPDIPVLQASSGSAPH